jgi:DNA (cytosine-5)-methyltransferase 1
MKHGSLFSGIGGFDLAAEWMGWENIFHCEIAEFPRQILKYHFPNSICYEDIKKTDFRKHRGEVDIISGGFPCQPYSNAGKRRGKEDDRHLWPEMLRVIREVQPRFVVGENVAGLLSWNNGMVFHEIITDLENEGYETQAFLIPACATNAPHRRDRIWFVAHSNNNRLQQSFNGKSKTNIFNESKKQEFKSNSKLFKSIKASSIREFAPHTDGTEQGNNLGENIGEEREIRRGEEGDVFGELRGDGNVADTNGIRGNKDAWRIDGESDVINQNGEARDVLHTDNTVKSGKYIRQKREGQFDKSDSRIGINNFENFPTQSPICGGDDGIPTQLDGITFSKWRNESIKGYGNAVVPQVVYQIFKAIEQSLL